MSRPDWITLSADAGEAILARLAVYAPSHADCEMLAQVLRLYMWLMVTLEEATVSIRRLRALFFGSRHTAKEPSASEASTSAREARGEGEGEDAWARGEAAPVGPSTIAPPA
jgi:hypothetical protein